MLETVLPTLLAEEQLDAFFNSRPTPDRIYQLVLTSTGDVEQAEEARATFVLRSGLAR